MLLMIWPSCWDRLQPLWLMFAHLCVHVCQDSGASCCVQEWTEAGNTDPAGRVKGHCQWQCCLPVDWAAAPGGCQHTSRYDLLRCLLKYSYTQSIFLALFHLPLGPPHSRFKLYLPVHWLSLWEGCGRLEPLRLRLLPVWTGCCWGHPPGWVEEDESSRDGFILKRNH